MTAPRRAVGTWGWKVQPRGVRPGLDTLAPFLPAPNQIPVGLTRSRDDVADPRTGTSIHLEQVPVGWLVDLETSRDYRLSIAEHAGCGVPE